jgi:PIN domain nuclease of toxin-antitoxin system
VAPVIYLDTHVVVWLYGLGAESLSPEAREAVGGSDDVRISPMVRLELQYLYEIGRVTRPAAEVVDSLGSELGVRVCDTDFLTVVHAAERLDFTRDPFDRLIVAQASVHRAPLVSKDEELHRHYDATIW